MVPFRLAANSASGNSASGFRVLRAKMAILFQF
jgi:hypothetical protein